MDVPLIDASQIKFEQTAFNMLMQRRIYRVLLVCSNYDYFIIEEDGRIEEQIFNEYARLKMQFPPVVVHANSAQMAFDVLQKGDIDLVILMLNIDDVDPFTLSLNLRSNYPLLPIVVLTHFSREVTTRLQSQDQSAIDYVFCWLGNADLIPAIIRLIEDKLNAEYDILEVDVQAILLVEDSIRHISHILPCIYNTILEQSQQFMLEGLNEHQQMLYQRGRPKVLLAKNYTEAQCLFERYGHHFLGIISDVNYKQSNTSTTETHQGLALCRSVRLIDSYMPILLQSSDASYSAQANALEVGFIHKQSRFLLSELNQYVIWHFGFGDFNFIHPQSGHVVAKASNLLELQSVIYQIPDEILALYAGRNEISKWLNARALFPIAKIFKMLQVSDFKNLNHVRQFIYTAISNFRNSKSHGVIAAFTPNQFDEQLTFSRIGNGSIGGKARGLAFLDAVIKKHQLQYRFENIEVQIPRTVVIGTDIFDLFLQENNLIALIPNSNDEEILTLFVNARLPGSIENQLISFAGNVTKPVAVRSSGMLEDSFYEPFAGIYSTYMIPVENGAVEHNYNLICKAIKAVYASVFYKNSKLYLSASANLLEQEKMAVILQEVSGNEYNNLFFPDISGVARSVNYYPLTPQNTNDGIVNIAFGLGKQVVDGSTSLRFCPKFPQNILQLSSIESSVRQTQSHFWAVDLSNKQWIPTVSDNYCLVNLPINDFVKTNKYNLVFSTLNTADLTITDDSKNEGLKITTFNGLLKYNKFPFSEMLTSLLQIISGEMNCAVEIEFAAIMNSDNQNKMQCSLLQVRPILRKNEQLIQPIGEINKTGTLFFSENTLGNGVYNNINDIIFVKPENFSSMKTHEIAREIEILNSKMRTEGRYYVLAGPGRWGTADPFLGIPVKWTHISNACLIVEQSIDNFDIEPSQGTHFFHNLTSFGVGYMSIRNSQGFANIKLLRQLHPMSETEYIIHFRVPTDLIILINGLQKKGIINLEL